jgi:hypothetical protein
LMPTMGMLRRSVGRALLSYCNSILALKLIIVVRPALYLASQILEANAFLKASTPPKMAKLISCYRALTACRL